MKNPLNLYLCSVCNLYYYCLLGFGVYQIIIFFFSWVTIRIDTPGPWLLRISVVRFSLMCIFKKYLWTSILTRHNAAHKMTQYSQMHNKCACPFIYFNCFTLEYTLFLYFYKLIANWRSVKTWMILWIHSLDQKAT